MTASELQRNAHVLVLQEMRDRFTEAGIPSRTAALDAAISALAARQPVRIYGCCAQLEGELHTDECPNIRHIAARQAVGATVKDSLTVGGGQAVGKEPAELQFVYRHADGRAHTVSVSADDVARGMPDFLSQALCARLCQCQPVGETNVTDCCCDEDAEQFDLIAAPPAQVVDLGQFRECVELMEWQERGHANPDWPVGDPKKHAEALRLLALIDSIASAGEPNTAPNRLTDTAQHDLFYIQDTRQFVGNCPMWWGPNGSGYVTRLDEAGRYTEQEAIRQNRTRETDVPWPCSEIDAIARQTVDCQHMRPRAERLAELALIDSQAVGNG